MQSISLCSCYSRIPVSFLLSTILLVTYPFFIKATHSLHIFLVKVYVLCAYPFVFTFLTCPDYYSLLPSYLILFSQYRWDTVDGM